MIDVIQYPNDVLKTITVNVDLFDAQLRDTVNNMVEAMYRTSGVGLAAPQIGSSQRLVIIDPSCGEEANQLLVLINPSVTWWSAKQTISAEGCLSLPGVVVNVKRSEAVQVDYDDLTGVHHRKLFNKHSPYARIVQHEIDHLDGILMIDHLGPMARKAALDDLFKRNK